MTRGGFHLWLTWLAALLFSSAVGAQAEPAAPYLLRDPTVSQTQVAFSFGGYIWIANRDSSGLRQLTTGGHDRKPCFSPDGSLIAFTAGYVDNVYDEHHSSGVYVVSASGGKARRLTYHPADLDVTGWTPDGKRVLFSSRRTAFEAHHQTIVQLFSIPAEGGAAVPVPLPRATQAALSPDATRIAYVPNVRLQPEWKHYRGGETTPIWIANLADSSLVAKIPRNNSNDSNPMWVGNTLYFLSDRNGPVTLFAYDLPSRQVRQVLRNDGLDIKSAAASTDAIVYEQFGSLHLLDLKSERDRELDIRPAGDFPEVAPHVRKIDSSQIQFAGLSPDGSRAVFGARGEVFTVAVQKNDETHDVTRTMDVAERDPAWSPDASAIAYFSDESGEYALHVRNLGENGKVRKFDLGTPPGFYYAPNWSPDSKKIGYTDQRLNFWYVDLQNGKSVQVDTDEFTDQTHCAQIAWSPDSRWMAYTKQLPSRLHAVFLYSLDEAKSYQLTDGSVDATDAVFDKSGQYLYFTASANAASSAAWMDMSSLDHPITRSVHLVVLRKGLTSPLTEDGKARSGKVSRVDIDLDGIAQRIVRLPVPARNYYALAPGKAGILFLVEGPAIGPLARGEGDTRVDRFDLRTRELKSILDEVVAFHRETRQYVSSFHVSFDGSTMLYRHRGRWLVASTDPTALDQRRPLELAHLEAYVDPRVEWKHMYDQVWRDERDFFYDPGLHGLSLETVREEYRSYLQNIVTRDDLNYLFSEMLANMAVGHIIVRGGEGSGTDIEPTGLLGADYTAVNGRYRFSHIYSGDPWNADIQAPLTQPGAEVAAGEYLLAVNGREVHSTQDVYGFFAGTADRPTVLTVGPDSDGKGSRQVTVVPVEDETGLRNHAWIEANRRKVDELTGGRVAYVYLPDTAALGYASFNRDFFSQVGKEAAIIDDRDNQGGIVADYIMDYLNRPLMNFWSMRYGRDLAEPQQAIFGPKVMLINEMSASNGDGLPWMFRKAEVGPLIGTRTWGGLVATTYVADDLLDGGMVSAPNRAFYNTNGAWDIENKGVGPDIEVEDDPKAVRAGHDPQLEKAAAVVLDLLRENGPAPVARHPPYVNYYPKNPK